MSDVLGRHSNICIWCKGTGKVEGYSCALCNGKGFNVEGLDEPIKEIQRGDILLIHFKFDPIGWLIQSYTQSKYNHVAWVINNHEVIELKATGKRRTPLNYYLNNYLYKCKVVRPILVKCKLNQALERAEEAIFEYPYSSSLLNYILLSLKITQSLPRLSCSGFIAYYLNQVGFSFCNKNPHIILPNDIENSKEIINI